MPIGIGLLLMTRGIAFVPVSHLLLHNATDSLLLRDGTSFFLLGHQ